MITKTCNTHSNTLAFYFQLNSPTAPPTVTLVCCRPGSKAEPPRLKTTGSVHYIFPPEERMAAARFIHNTQTHTHSDLTAQSEKSAKLNALEGKRLHV